MISNFISRKNITVITLLTIVIILVFFINPLFIVAHSIINVFAGGRSTIKTFLFLFYLLGLFILNIIPQVGNFSQKKLHILSYVLGIGLGILLVINLGSFLYLIQTQNLNIHDYFIFFDQGELSTTNLLHNHTLKAVVAAIFPLIGFQKLENLDFGWPFLSFFPLPFLIITGLLFLVLLILAFLYFYPPTQETMNVSPWINASNFPLLPRPPNRRAGRRISLQRSAKKGSHWRKPVEFHFLPSEKKKSNLFLLLFSIITFSLFKNVIDGGLLNCETIVSFLFFPLLIFPKQKNWVRYIGGGISIYFILLLFLYWRQFFLQDQTFQEAIIPIIGKTLLYTGILICFFYFLNHGLKERLGKLLLAFCLLLLLISLIPAYTEFIYNEKKIDSEHEAIIALYEKIDRSDFEFLGNINDLNFYQVQPSQEIKVSQLFRDYHLLDNLNPISFPWQNCLPNGIPKRYAFQLQTDQELQGLKNPDNFVQIISVQFQEKKSSQNLYSIELNISSCTPRTLNVIEETLKLNGLDDFIIINLEELDNKNDFRN